jgi:hypothetical protein
MKGSINIRLEREHQRNVCHDIRFLPGSHPKVYAVEVRNIMHLQNGVVTACGEIMQQIIHGFPLDWPKLLCEWWT